MFAKKRTKLNKQKNDEIESVKQNTEIIKELDGKIGQVLGETKEIMSGLKNSYKGCLDMFSGDYGTFSEEQKLKLGALVNNTKALSAMFDKTIG